MLGTDIIDTLALSSLVICGPEHLKGTQDHGSSGRKHHTPLMEGSKLRGWGETSLLYVELGHKESGVLPEPLFPHLGVDWCWAG